MNATAYASSSNSSTFKEDSSAFSDEASDENDDADAIRNDSDDDMQGISRSMSQSQPSGSDSHVEKKKRVSKARLNAAYAQLLNEPNEGPNGIEPNHRDEAPASYIGASFWTADEKLALSAAIARHGQDNLPLLSRSVTTKGELEVRAYILYMQDKTHDALPHDGLLFQPPSAALEIGRNCENLLNRTADTYREQVYAQEIELEKAKFGERWLIDETSATVISEEQDDSSETLEDTSNDSSPLPLNSFNVLDSEMLLHLSRTYFMNPPTSTGENWRTIGELDIASSTPAMFQSTLEELYTITRSLTRKIVHASILQATSRHRAKDDDRSTPSITSRDVKVSCDLLGLKPDWRSYWAHMPRRCGVEVYSRSKKDGGEKGKIGVKLSYDAVEAELGYPPSSTIHPNKGGDTDAKFEVQSTQTDGGESTDVEEDETSRLSSSNTSFSPSSSSSDDNNDEQGDEDGHDSNTHNTEPESGQSDDEEGNEDEALENYDMQESMADEKRIREVLNFPTPTQTDSEQKEPVARPTLKRTLSSETVDWRKRIKYRAEWEVR